MNKDKVELENKYGDLFEQVSAILFKHDIMRVNLGENTVEYDLEVGTILPKLLGAKGVHDVTLIIFQEFSKWFGEEWVPPLGSGVYKSMARDLWALQQDYINRPAS
jgi:hypothetical protein